MGNALRFLYGYCCKPTTPEPDSGTIGHHGVSPLNVGVSILAHHLLNYDITSQVPERLDKHVLSSKRSQASWYQKISVAWRASKPPPRVPEEASRLVVETLKSDENADVLGLLTFYGLPLPRTTVELTACFPSSLPHGVKYEMHTLPVDAKAVADGDSMTVYINTEDNPRESTAIPRDVQLAVVERSKARSQKNYAKADELQKIIVDYGYRVLKRQNVEILGRKYRIRLRGIDAPEWGMPYGEESKEELVNLVKGESLRVLVYEEDRYGRSVADVYCNGIFVQELMLKKGLAWHYAAYDRRLELANWEKGARAGRVGLWALTDPKKPWDWRKDRRDSEANFSNFIKNLLKLYHAVFGTNMEKGKVTNKSKLY